MEKGSAFNKIPMLKMEEISKAFSGNLAVNKVNFICKEGEIHGLVGENGAGKSTLMRVLVGVYQPDNGRIIIKGKEKKLSCYSDAKQAKIGMVYQELSLFPHLSVAENIFVGNWPKKKKFIDWQKINSKSEKILKKIGIEINPSLLIKSLPMASRQMVEIAKLIAQDPDIFIFDEPTSALSQNEVSRLFDLLKELKTQGKSIIYISHRLKEILEISDVITVMKDGIKVITENVKYFDENKLINCMIGRELSEIFPKKYIRKKEEESLYFEGISEKTNNKVIFTFFKGEVVGFGGLQGQGQIEVLQSIFGLRGYKNKVFKLFNKNLKIESPYSAMKKGIYLIPENRGEEGAFLNLSVLHNLTASKIDNIQRYGLIQKKVERKIAEAVVKELSIKITSLDQIVQYLSGGNLQKVVLGKCLISKPRVIIMLEPTKGVDVATKQQIYILIRELIKNDVTIILYTSDMLELIGLCDRVLVMNRGVISGELEGKEICEERIMKAAVSDINILEEG